MCTHTKLFYARTHTHYYILICIRNTEQLGLFQGCAQVEITDLRGTRICVNIAVRHRAVIQYLQLAFVQTPTLMFSVEIRTTEKHIWQRYI